ncbi:MAG: hypothetical protein EPN31_12165 [Castellaniella sp.]|uniref:hypothetical protein n=1 Tax=Castellaniella sp. TaxID=1955812 RepID=UPI00122608A3|nr:hypothetical protein [Castellaniella sp.]TAN27282.1 MAG: hypothetical protein EPN31_12165 [Castellaniella sp.]
MTTTCDYCGSGLDCEIGSAVERRYWSSAIGPRICNACLLSRCDDYPDLQGDERVAALRLRYAKQWPSGEKVSHELKPGRVVQVVRDDGMSVKTIRDTIKAAQGVIDPVLVRQAERELEGFFALHRDGELLAAMQAGKAAWNTANIIHTMLDSKADVLEGRRSKRQQIINGLSSGKERQAERKPDWDKWQAEADRMGAVNPRLSRNAVAEKIAPVCGVSSETIRRRIKKTW